MDFSKLVPVGNANPTGQSFDLKWSAATEKFRFSDKLYASMQLEYNSLTQYETADKTVIIGVVPGNAGVFYKKQKGSAKGKTFKNARLSQSCTEAGLDKVTLTVMHLGNNDGIEMYRIVDGKSVVKEEVDTVTEEHDAQMAEEADDNPYLEPEEKNVELKDEF